MRRVLSGVGLIGLLAGWVPAAAAQQGTAELRGRVLDEAGAVLPGVAIVLTNEESGVFRDVTSSGDGTYFVSQVTPGRYRIAASLSGFRTLERRNVVLEVGKTLTLDLTLAIGGIQENLTVTADTPLVDLTSAEVGGNITSAELTALPTPNRNYFAAVALLPGVQFQPSADLGNDTIIATGQASQGNNVTLDGGYNTDDSLGSSVGGQTRTPIESIQEFQVLTNQFDAEFGRATGAVINAVSKQGTNQFRGVGFGYYVNSDLRAKDYFTRVGNLPKPETSMEQWGGTLGGPIVRNKMHFFFSLERLAEKPNRARTFPTRPEFNFSTTEIRSAWNTMIRVDHQINADNNWGVRWLRESAPQIPIIANRGSLSPTNGSFTDETDLDQTVVGTYQTIFGNTRVNTFRTSATIESWYRANACWRASNGPQSSCPPTLDHLSFFTQQHPQATGPKDRNYQIEDTFSWYVPERLGNHDFKVGARYHYTELERNVQSNANGTFLFSTDLAFDPANPRTYPERLTIRVGEFNLFMRSHALELFAQDKWAVNRRLTLSVGLRYDLEATPVNEADNPLFSDPNAYPVDGNNIAPRLGITYGLDDEGRSVLRGGYGLFYGRTILGTIDDFFEDRKYSSSFEVVFPGPGLVDPGPSSGQLPTNPFLRNGPVVDRNLLNASIPPGTLQRNRGVVTLDSPDRRQPFTHQMTVGYERQLGSTLSVAADYIRMVGKDMFLTRNLNPMVRANTSRSGAITRVDAFGILGEPYFDRVWLLENTGENLYDALNLQMEKRESQNWAGRVSYSLSSSRGTASAQGDDNLFQVLDDLRLDDWWAPSAVDRRHILTIYGRMTVPRTGGLMVAATSRYMSGAPFTIHNTNIDADRNGEFFDPLPAGIYSGTAADAMTNVENKGGRNGARGPEFYQLDLRVSYRVRLGGQRTLDLSADVFNATDRPNFEVPSGDLRLTATFLRPTALYGGSGFPRQAQIGARFAF
jgi:hypothetical protein